MTETLSEPKSPKLSIASLALGIVALAVFWSVMFAAVAHVDGAENVVLLVAMVAGVILGLGAVVTGILARRRVRRGIAARGGIALAGIVLGVLAVIVPAALLAYLVYAVYSGYEEFEACVRGSGTANPDYMCLKECPLFLDSLCRKHIRW
ncbi:hypothetical protein A5641_14205 [Mycobacterium sp. 1554424.7]|nr:hypothetical protein A5641_14205 [Mycobacterium sp. 1554424.7]